MNIKIKNGEIHILAFTLSCENVNMSECVTLCVKRVPKYKAEKTLEPHTCKTCIKLEAKKQ